MVSTLNLHSTVKRERFFAHVCFSNETVSQTTVSTHRLDDSPFYANLAELYETQGQLISRDVIFSGVVMLWGNSLITSWCKLSPENIGSTNCPTASWFSETSGCKLSSGKTSSADSTKGWPAVSFSNSRWRSVSCAEWVKNSSSLHRKGLKPEKGPSHAYYFLVWRMKTN